MVGVPGSKLPPSRGKPNSSITSGLFSAPRDVRLLRNIFPRVALDGRPRACEILRVRPVPVLRPDVGVHVIDGWRAVRVDDALRVVDAALRAFASGGNHVVRVDRLDEARGPVDPLEIGCHVAAPRFVASAGPRLVGELPGKDRRIVAV